MGDMADDLLDKVFDTLYDDDTGEYVGDDGCYFPRQPKPLTCRRCGKRGLHWQQFLIAGRLAWRTTEPDGQMHHCIAPLLHD